MSDIAFAAERLTDHKELAVLQLLTPFKGPVLLAGAFKGETIEAIKILDSQVEIHAFEPQEWCLKLLQEKFGEDEKVIIHSVALGVSSGYQNLNRIGSEWASLIDTNRLDEHSEEVLMVEASEYIKNSSSKTWSVFIFNMEGYEYALVPYLGLMGTLAKVDNLLVQCHPWLLNVESPPPVPEEFNLLWNYFPAWVWWSKQWSKQQP